MKLYDLIIIGAGPAGITAAVYAARKKMDFLVLTGDIGGQAAWSGDIENYTGYQFISGPELAQKFEEHMRKYDVPVKEKEEVIEIRKLEKDILVKTLRGEYQSKTVIIASGKRSKELGVPGEKEFKNKGLTYCATCDGPLFAGKDVAIIGGGNSALDAALQLIKIARKVYIINNTLNLGGDLIMRQKVESAENTVIKNNSQVSAVLGDKLVEKIRVVSQGREEEISVQGIFVEVGLIPNSGFIKDVEKNSHGEIKINSYNETSIPGIFAAGDVTDVPQKQIIIAAGEGSKASLGAFNYLSRN
ncbi:MAG: FAD-dependent oxidoreductase [Candidatus Omnitrophica bacterium]|nr:FAD-dependent oxidoreductase [Candidatus Omnitrophota bacterium]MDD3988109.1 FAD-dependent oxidoreductase [Candidatus Omnitrophota bacterium]MDD4981496.1 FAD-dependent oxidoreductase [Candidatus Omnitrophota bacterium]